MKPSYQTRPATRVVGLLTLLSLAAIGLLLLWPAQAQAQIDEQLVQRLKKTAVTVHISVSHGVNAERPGRFGGTGFVVDARLGIIATNRHLTPTGPSQAKVIFENGESVDAQVLHYDAHHDFAFYKVDVSRANFPLVAAELGSSFSLKEQDEVFLIGNNEGLGHSVKFGRVTNLVLDMGRRHTATGTEIAVLLLNSAAETAKDAVDRLREIGIRAGVVSPNVLRPFPASFTVGSHAAWLGIFPCLPGLHHDVPGFGLGCTARGRHGHFPPFPARIKRG